MNANNLFYPEQPGLYLAQNGKIVCFVQFVGWFPNIQPKKAIMLNNFINASVEEDDSIFTAKYLSNKELLADKDVLNSIAYDRGSWTFSVLPIDFNIFPRWEKRYCDKLNIPDYKLIELYEEYIRMEQSQISFTKMVSIIKVRCNCSTEDAIKVINMFDEKKHGKHVF